MIHKQTKLPYFGALLNMFLYLLVHGFLQSVFWAKPYLGNDSQSYITPALSFVTNGTFHEMIYRTPFYPTFLAAHNLLFGEPNWLIMVYISQVILCAIAIALLTMVLASRKVSLKLQVFFGIILTVYPALFYYEAYILTESVAFFLLSLYVFVANKLFIENSLKWYLILGIIVGMLILHRPDYIAIPISMLIFLIILFFIEKQPISISGIGLFSLPVMLLSGAWILRNLFVMGFLGLTVGAGTALFYHVHEDIEAGRSANNTEIVDQLISLHEINPVPGIVHGASRVNADGSPRNIEEQVDYWKTITNLTLRTIVVEPWKYLQSVGGAIYAITHPAAGFNQSKRFFGEWSKTPWKIYRIIHFLGLMVITILVIQLFSQLYMDYPNLSLKDTYIPFLIITILGYCLINVLLTNAGSNRYRMPFDGIIIMIGFLSYYTTRLNRNKIQL